MRGWKCKQNRASAERSGEKFQEDYRRPNHEVMEFRAHTTATTTFLSCWTSDIPQTSFSLLMLPPLSTRREGKTPDCLLTFSIFPWFFALPMCRVKCNLKISEMNYLHNRYFSLWENNTQCPTMTAACRCERMLRQASLLDANELIKWKLQVFLSLLSDCLEVSFVIYNSQFFPCACDDAFPSGMLCSFKAFRGDD